MTGYHLRLGYSAMRPDRAANWEAMKKTAFDVGCNPGDIIKEALRCGAPEQDEHGETLSDYVSKLIPPWTDLTLTILEASHYGDDPEICLMASGCDSTGMKYHVRRAFIRVFMAEMHKQDIEVCLSVA